jgi:hypothetical protein
VSDVEPAHSLLKTYPAELIFENKIGKKILFFPENQANESLVNCPNNGLIQTIQECYDQHRPLILTPDVIWLAICQGISIHINQNYDSFKNTLFDENKPEQIIVRNDSLEYASKHWGELIQSFSDETKKYTKSDFYSFFVSEFSTTTAIELTAYQITMLESFKKNFQYIAESGCGIPSITITGNKRDWQLILEKLQILDQIGLSEWATNLRPIIEQFIAASKGKIDKTFWQDIYKNVVEYNAFYISGWIIKFFPYIKELESIDGEYGGVKETEVFMPNEFINGYDYLRSTLSTDNFPSGIAKIDVKWINYFKNITKEMEVCAGFFAARQYSDKSLEPVISWTISEEDGKAAEHNLSSDNTYALKHNYERYWTPRIITKLADSAIYNSKNFKTQAQSLSFVKKMLMDSLQHNSAFQESDYKNDTINIVVLANGRLGTIFITGKQDKTPLTEYVKKLLYNLPQKWFPALAYPDNVMDMDLEYEFTDEERKIKIRVNSSVEIILSEI